MFKLLGTACYLIHPRGRAKIISAVKQYKKKKNNIHNKFSPDVSAEHLFSIAVTYTFYYPLFDYTIQNNYENTYSIKQKEKLTNEFIEYTNRARRNRTK